jgi:hypothetical protein
MARPCDICSVWNQFYQSTMQQLGRALYYNDNKASNVIQLMELAYFQEPSATIVGDGLDDIAGDINMQTQQKKMIDQITADPRYKNKDFDGSVDTLSITFGEMGHKNMLEDALHGQTWTVRAANIDPKFNVTKAGDITFNYTLSDTLDLVPDWEHRTGVSGFFYNVTTSIAGPVWHGLLGARKMAVNASWTTTIKHDEIEEK